MTTRRRSSPSRRLPGHDILFEEVRIGPRRLKNRFYQVPHCTGFGTEKPFSQAAFRAMKAEGGWAAVCTEYAPVSPDSDTSVSVSARLWDEGDARNLTLMSEAVHAHGALSGIELHHGGAMADPRGSRWPALGPSPLANRIHPSGATPKEMDEYDIARVKSDWVAAAKRARDAGFDIVYVYGGHSFLLAQFLSPILNRRTDAYGGSLTDRARLWTETLEAVRQAVGTDCAVAVRFAVDALGPWGVARDEGLEFVALADDLVDLWDVSIGGVAGADRLDSGSSRFFKEGYQLEWTRGIRQQTAKPIVGVGRFTNPDTMAAVVRSGELDLIGAARPSIADPFLPLKVEEGRYGEIRECIGCNFCYSRAEYGGHIACTQNATAGEEYRRGWHPERFRPAQNAGRDVLVVGAGPAGMECAIVLAKRGFRRVHLVEAESDVGGCLAWMARLPGLGEWKRVVDWRKIQLDGLSKTVELIAGTRLGPEDILGYGADIVICATGSYWASECLSAGLATRSGESLPAVVTPEEVMTSTGRPLGGRIVVYDCDGYIVGSCLAEKLAADALKVVLVTPFEQASPISHEMLEALFVRRRLHDVGVEVLTETLLDSLGPQRVLGIGPFGRPVEIEADSVVVVTQRLARDDLYKSLRAMPAERMSSDGIEAVYRVGDCVAPRLLGDAIFDGHRLAREIDSQDPAVPLPHLRERPVVGVAPYPF